MICPTGRTNVFALDVRIFRASGVRTGASAGRAGTGPLPWFLRSVLNRPSQEVGRELASGERFSAASASGRSTGPARKPEETCHSAGLSVWRRTRLVWELAERVGFEPTVRLPVLRFSRPTRSTAPAPLLDRQTPPEERTPNRRQPQARWDYPTAFCSRTVGTRTSGQSSSARRRRQSEEKNTTIAP